MIRRLLIPFLLVLFCLPNGISAYLTQRAEREAASPPKSPPEAQVATTNTAETEPSTPDLHLAQPDGVPAKDVPQSASYRLIVRDQVQMTVYGQPDLTVAQRIDGEGMIRIPLLGNVVIAGMSVREVEKELENAFVEQEYLRSPLVTMRVTDYAPREITVFGAVNSPGTFTLPLEVNSMDIVEVISKVGGFTPVARGNSVRIVRNRGQPDENVETVNVDRMITGQSPDNQEPVMVYPGDLVQVNQSMF